MLVGKLHLPPERRGSKDCSAAIIVPESFSNLTTTMAEEDNVRYGSCCICTEELSLEEAAVWRSKAPACAAASHSCCATCLEIWLLHTKAVNSSDVETTTLVPRCLSSIFLSSSAASITVEQAASVVPALCPGYLPIALLDALAPEAAAAWSRRVATGRAASTCVITETSARANARGRGGWPTSWWGECLTYVVVQRSSRKCPSCKAATTRISGCRHMICSRCGASWCWDCGGTPSIACGCVIGEMETRWQAMKRLPAVVLRLRAAGDDEEGGGEASLPRCSSVCDAAYFVARAIAWTLYAVIFPALLIGWYALHVAMAVLSAPVIMLMACIDVVLDERGEAYFGIVWDLHEWVKSATTGGTLWPPDTMPRLRCVLLSCCVVVFHLAVTAPLLVGVYVGVLLWCILCSPVWFIDVCFNDASTEGQRHPNIDPVLPFGILIDGSPFDRRYNY